MFRSSVSCTVACLGALAWSAAVRSAPTQPTASIAQPEARAVAFLSREVPRWRQEHPCYSCHNNGDAARALLAAWRHGHDVRAALADTLDWLADPPRWESNGGGEGGGDDKVLARIQFAAATTDARVESRVAAGALDAAASLLAADQQRDGSWRLDASDSIGSPATYGTVLATAFARRTLVRAANPAYRSAATRAGAWLAGVKVANTPDAAGVILGVVDIVDAAAPTRAALEFLLRTQGRDGGWGPYATSPAEVFDTAAAVIALRSIDTQRAAASSHRPETLRDAVARGRAYLRREQLDDGSWMETTRPARQQSYAQRISTSAWALLALLD